MSNPARPRAPNDDVVLTDLHAAADELVAAVHAQSAHRVELALAKARAEHTGDDPLLALVVLLAAAVPDDAPVAELVAWVQDPSAFRRLRAAGADHARACAVIADRQHRLASDPGRER